MNNSDFTGARENSKSIYGYLYTLFGGPITWKCKKVNIIVLNIPKTETDALTETLRKTQWFKNLFIKFGLPIKSPITIFGNNIGFIINVYNPTHH